MQRSELMDPAGTARIPTRPWDVRSVAITGLFVLALFYTLRVARVVLLPVTLAILLSFLFSPVVRGLRRLRIPQVAGAGLVVAVLVAALVGGGALLIGPAEEWLTKAPERVRLVEDRVRHLLRPAAKLGEAAEQVQHMTDGGQSRAPMVQLKGPSWNETALGWTKGLVGGAVVTLVLLYFLLASGDLFVWKVVKSLPALQEKKRVVEIARKTEHNISRYLFTITIINGCLGAAVGVAMFLLGLSNPLLWAVVAALLNFIPYFGPMTGCLVLALAALVQFPSWGQALLPPAAYLALHGIEANFITPTLLGRRLMLDPAVMFISLVFWGWLWGVAGALMAVPILMALKVLCDQIEPLAPISEFLEG